MASRTKTLDDLFERSLRDVYDAERTILKALPKLIKAARADRLKALFERHTGETERQITRLEGIFDLIGIRSEPGRCAAMEGLVLDTKTFIADFKKSGEIDDGLIAGGQAMEQYEIARYVALSTLATRLGHETAADLLDATIAEERALAQDLRALSEPSTEKREPPEVAAVTKPSARRRSAASVNKAEPPVLEAEATAPAPVRAASTRRRAKPSPKIAAVVAAP